MKRIFLVDMPTILMAWHTQIQCSCRTSFLFGAVVLLLSLLLRAGSTRLDLSSEECVVHSKSKHQNSKSFRCFTWVRCIHTLIILNIYKSGGDSSWEAILDAHFLCQGAVRGPRTFLTWKVRQLGTPYRMVPQGKLHGYQENSQRTCGFLLAAQLGSSNKLATRFVHVKRNKQIGHVENHPEPPCAFLKTRCPF